VALADHGYHPTVATPGTRNIYFWVLAALDPSKRSYKKAVTDKYFT
jgi:5-deoxy-glucuronate isomerase